MILKPSSCAGCPFYTYGKYFTPDNIPDNAQVVFIAQNPGENEEAGKKLVKRHYQGSQYFDETTQVQPQPLIGATGQLFDNRFLPLSGLKREHIGVANAIRCRPGKDLHMRADDLPPLTVKMHLESSNADIVKALKHCRDTYLKIPNSTKLIVTMGRYAQFSLTGIQNEETEYKKKQGVLESWRGYGVNVTSTRDWHTVDTTYYHDMRSNIRLFFTMHIAALFKGENKRYFHATLEDFYKIGRLLRGEWPLPLPQWSNKSPNIWPQFSCFDTEYNPETQELYRWSLCDDKYRLYCVELEDTSTIINQHTSSTVLLQNALADISYLPLLINIENVTLHDMMLAHSVLWTGEPHSLNYIASKYGAFNRYKHLSADQPQLYSALDAFEPMYMWRNHFLREFEKDRQSYEIYKNIRLPLIHIIDKAQKAGISLDGQRLRDVQRILKEKCEELKERAKVITNDPTFKLNSSKSMKGLLYGYY